MAPTSQIQLKIQKLLALSRSNSNHHEAALALKKAKELMDKYHVQEPAQKQPSKSHSKQKKADVKAKWSHPSVEIRGRAIWLLRNSKITLAEEFLFKQRKNSVLIEAELLILDLFVRLKNLNAQVTKQTRDDYNRCSDFASRYHHCLGDVYVLHALYCKAIKNEKEAKKSFDYAIMSYKQCKSSAGLKLAKSELSDLEKEIKKRAWIKKKLAFTRVITEPLGKWSFFMFYMIINSLLWISLS